MRHEVEWHRLGTATAHYVWGSADGFGKAVCGRQGPMTLDPDATKCRRCVKYLERRAEGSRT